MVTSLYLLKGAIYAFEQCGLLLYDALMLYEKKSYSSSIVIAAFAREELGKSRILRKLRRDVVSGKTFTIKQIKDHTEDHVEKQEYAQLSTMQRASRGERLAELLRARIRYNPQSKEFKAADKELNETTKLQRKRTPKQRHEARLNALYVEPNESGSTWSRPNETSRETAWIFLLELANDYAVAHQNLDPEIVRQSDPEFAGALEEWHDRPTLPQPQFPPFQ